MLELLPAPAPHVVAFRVGGTLQGPAVARVFDALEDALAEHATVNLYAEIVDLRGLSLEAALKDTVASLKLLPRLGRIGRYAVVANQAWIRTAASLEGRLHPGLTVRAFGLEEAEEALAWVTDGTG